MTKNKEPRSGCRDTSGEPVELVWAVVQQQWDHKRALVVLPRRVFEHWMERLPALSCTTWGELRRTATPEVYAEICDLCGYGTFDDYTWYLAITGEAPLPDLYDRAAELYDPDATPPGDEVPFDPYTDIGGCEEGDWPPAVPELMNEELPGAILDAYAKRYTTVLNGPYAELSADDTDAVLRDLATLGHRLEHEPRLARLVNCRW